MKFLYSFSHTGNFPNSVFLLTTIAAPFIEEVFIIQHLYSVHYNENTVSAFIIFKPVQQNVFILQD